MLPCIGSHTQATSTPGGGDLLDQGRQPVADLAGAEAGDEREPARLVRRVELRGQRDRVVGRRGRAELDADRVLDVAEQLDVGAVELAGALADPDEVARDVVRRLRCGESMRVIACSYSSISASWLEWKSTRWNSSGSAPIAFMNVSARSISAAICS